MEGGTRPDAGPDRRALCSRPLDTDPRLIRDDGDERAGDMAFEASEERAVQRQPIGSPEFIDGHRRHRRAESQRGQR